MIRMSTGLKTAMMGSFGLQSMMNYGIIDIYDGDQPATADMPATGNKLGTITNGGLAHVPTTTTGGLQLVLDGAGALVKTGSWVLNGSDTGVTTWWRWRWNGPDDDSQSLFMPRMDGLVGESLILATATIGPSTSVTLDSFTINFRETDPCP